jgi:hypothetical protein
MNLSSIAVNSLISIANVIYSSINVEAMHLYKNFIESKLTINSIKFLPVLQL